jgi:hypothetical protein
MIVTRVPTRSDITQFDGSRSGRRPVWKRVGLGGIRLVAQPPIGPPLHAARNTDGHLGR